MFQRPPAVTVSLLALVFTAGCASSSMSNGDVIAEDASVPDSSPAQQPDATEVPKDADIDVPSKPVVPPCSEPDNCPMLIWGTEFGWDYASPDGDGWLGKKCSANDATQCMLPLSNDIALFLNDTLAGETDVHNATSKVVVRLNNLATKYKNNLVLRKVEAAETNQVIIQQESRHGPNFDYTKHDYLKSEFAHVHCNKAKNIPTYPATYAASHQICTVVYVTLDSASLNKWIQAQATAQGYDSLKTIRFQSAIWESVLGWAILKAQGGATQPLAPNGDCQGNTGDTMQWQNSCLQSNTTSGQPDEVRYDDDLGGVQYPPNGAACVIMEDSELTDLSTCPAVP